MKKILNCLIFCLWIATIANAQDSTENKVISIRNEYNKIQSNIKNCKKNAYTWSNQNSKSSEIKFEAYYLPYGRMVKLDAVTIIEGVEKHLEYYCKGNSVVFIFLQEKQTNGTLIQRRVYFDDNHKLIRDIVKEKKVGETRDFSKIPDVKSNTSWPAIKLIIGFDFYGDEIVQKYLSYPAFENIGDNDQKIKKIKEEYAKIAESAKSGTLTEKNVEFTDSVAYWNNTSYTAYYDQESKLVLLKYAVGEEGYASEVEIYFKNRKPFFTFHINSEPDDSQSQERIYFYNDKIVSALIKKKSPSETKDFSEIKNEPNNEILKQIDKSSENLLNEIETEVNRMFEGYEMSEK